MTAAGYLEYDSAADAYALPEEHAFLLASEGTDHFMGGLFYVEPVVLGAAPKVADCFRTGGGVRFEDFGPECVDLHGTQAHGSVASRSRLRQG